MKKLASILISIIFTASVAVAAVTVTVNGSSHSIPQTNERGWGSNLTAWIQAISQYALYPSGGTFTLTADVDFGSSYGLKAPYYLSKATNPSTAGIFRLGNNESIGWRNAANGGNLLLKVNASDQLEFNGTVLAGSSGASFQDSTTTIYDNADTTKKMQFQVSGVTTGTTRTLTVPDADTTIVGTDTTQTLTNKTIAAGSNTISGLTNSNLSGSAAITDANLATISTAGKVANSATTAASANTASAIVARDGSGNFSAGTITANVTGNLTGNASTATALAANPADCAANQYATTIAANGDLTCAQVGFSQVSGSVASTQMPALTGDVTTSAGAVATTIANSAVTNAKMANMANNTVKGNISGGSAAPSDVSATSAATASTVALRDSNGNAAFNRHPQGYATTATAASTTTLSASSAYNQYFTGTSTQTVKMPDATTMLQTGDGFRIVNLSTGLLTIQDNSGGAITTLGPNASVTITAKSIGSVAGSWDATGSSSGGISAWAASYPYTAGNLVTYGGAIYTAASSFTSGASFEADAATAGKWNFVGKSNSIKNIVTYGNDFEDNDVAGWTATGCATVTNGLCASVGSGAAVFSSSNGGRAKGANTSSPAVDSSSAIEGTYALNLATTGAGTIGDGYISGAYPVEPAYRGKVLQFRGKFKVASGTPVMGGTSSDTYAVQIYDVANNAWMGNTGTFSFTQSSGVGEFKGEFQTLTTTTSVQIFIYSPVAPTGASSLLIDSVGIYEQIKSYGPAVTDPVAYTPTFTGIGTPTNVSAYWMQIGKIIKVWGSGTTGTVSGATFSISLPSGMALDTTSYSTTKYQIVGRGVNTTTGSTIFPTVGAGPWPLFIDASSSSGLVYMGNSASSNDFTKFAGNAPFGNTQNFNFEFEVAVAGKSSGQLLSSDADTRVVAMAATNITAASTTSSACFIYPTVIKDTHGAYNASTGKYTIPVSGWYAIKAFSYLGAAAGTSSNIVIDGVSGQQGVGNVANTSPAFVYDLQYLNAGQIVEIRPTATVTPTSSATLSSFSIQRISGPSQIAASESVNARYTNTAATSLSHNTTTKIPFATKSFDSHGAFVTDTYTCQLSGKYQVSVALTFSANSTGERQLWIGKNGSSVSSVLAHVKGTATYDNYMSVTDIISCIAGDTLAVYGWQDSGGSLALASYAGSNVVTITRVGNY